MRQIKLNERVLVKTSSIPELKGKIVTVKQIKWIELTVRIFPRGRIDYYLLDSDIEFLEPEKLLISEKKRIVKSFFDPNFIKSFKGIEYHQFINREIGILNELVEKYPDLSFWRNYIPDFSVKSICWYFSPDGEALLKKHYSTFVSKVEFVKKESNIGEQKLGEDIKIQKPKSVFDWLN